MACSHQNMTSTSCMRIEWHFFPVVAITHASLRMHVVNLGAKNYTLLESSMTIQGINLCPYQMTIRSHASK